MSKGFQVLIVEDDVEIQTASAELFSREGYEVAVATNGAEAIEMLDGGGELPCAVLVDLLMPGIIGTSVLEFMRNDDRLASVPVAIISGSPQLAPKGYVVFPKPLDAEALLDFVGARCTCRTCTTKDDAEP